MTDSPIETLAIFADRWLTTIRPTVRITTWREYRQKVSYAVEHLGDQPLDAIGPHDVLSLYGTLLTSGRRTGAGGLSAWSVIGVHRVLRRMLGHAVAWGRLDRSPMDHVDPPRLPASTRRTWSLPQLRTFLDHIRGDRWEALWRLYAITGMRRSEALGLRWEDLDLASGWATIRRTHVSYGPRVVVHTPKTRAGHRSVGLDGSTIRMLEEHRRCDEERLARLGRALLRPDDLVFAWENGWGVNPRTVTRWFKAHAAAAAVPVIDLHELRHTAATLSLLEAGVPMKVLSEQLGHSTIQVTLDTYSHVGDAARRDAAEAYARVVDARE